MLFVQVAQSGSLAVGRGLGMVWEGLWEALRGSVRAFLGGGGQGYGDGLSIALAGSQELAEGVLLSCMVWRKRGSVAGTLGGAVGLSGGLWERGRGLVLGHAVGLSGGLWGTLAGVWLWVWSGSLGGVKGTG